MASVLLKTNPKRQSLIPLEEWLHHIREEYLDRFISAGGGAVKFLAAPSPTDFAKAREEMAAAGRQQGYFFVSLDSKLVKTHLIDKLFHAVAKEVPWMELSRHFVEQLAREEQLTLSETPFNLREAALLNGQDSKQLVWRLNQLLQRKIFSNIRLTHEFKMAMMRLCQRTINPEDISLMNADAVIEWLHGDLRHIGALKPLQIFQKIARHNGRDMLFSLAHWLHLTGYSGLILTIDLERVLEEIKPAERKEGELYYSLQACMDTYETLRQFIDASHELDHGFLLVAVPKAFIENEKRGFSSYDALRLRLIDDVRDRERGNPLGPLVKLSESTVEGESIS